MISWLGVDTKPHYGKLSYCTVYVYTHPVNSEFTVLKNVKKVDAFGTIQF